MSDYELTDLAGVGEGTAENLEDAGYSDVIAVARASVRTLSEEVTGMAEGSAEKTIDSARRKLREGNSRFKTGMDVDEQQGEAPKITTGSEALDELLDGGVHVGSLTECFGKSSSGKTQLCHQLAVNVQLPEDEGGLGKGAIFIDTEETFVADRIRNMAEAKGLDPEEVLENIHVTHPEDGAEQVRAIKDAVSELDLEDKGVMIIDSIIAHFRAEYSDLNNLGDRQDRLGEMLKELQGIASGYDVAVFYSNQAYDDPGEHFGDSTKATGGNVLTHNSSYRLYSQDRQSKGWAVELVDSPYLPQEVRRFDVDDTGIIDTDAS